MPFQPISISSFHEHMNIKCLVICIVVMEVDAKTLHVLLDEFEPVEATKQQVRDV